MEVEDVGEHGRFYEISVWYAVVWLKFVLEDEEMLG